MLYASKRPSATIVFIQILQEVHELKKPTLRFWGKDKQFVFTIVILDRVSQTTLIDAITRACQILEFTPIDGAIAASMMML